MAFTATLELTAEPVHFPVLEFHWAVVQQSGERNEPMAGILAGQLHLVLDHLHHPVLDHWMADSDKLHDGRLVVLGLDGVRFRTVQFERAYCVSEGFYFNSTGNGRATAMSVLISAQRLLVDGEVKLDNKWPDR